MIQPRVLRRALWVLGIAALAIVYTNLAATLSERGLFSATTKYVAERAYIGLHSAAPVENLALVYPPLPIIFHALIRPPSLTTAVLCTIATTSLIWIAIRYSRDTETAVLAALAMLTPAVTLIALDDATAWVFAAMLAWAMYLLARYSEKEYSFYLFEAGLIIALGMFIDLRMGIFAITVALFLFLDYALNQFWRGVSVALVLIFPVFFFFVSWTFVEWVFTGKWGFLLPPLAARPIFQAWPAGVAYAIALLGVAITPRGTQRQYLLAICFAPVIITLLAGPAGLTLGAGEIALIGLAYALVTLTQIGNVWLRRVAAGALLLGSLGLSYTLPPIATQMLNLDPVELIPPPVVTHYAWEGWVLVMRIVLAVILAILTVLLAAHSLRKLTGEARTS